MVSATLGAASGSTETGVLVSTATAIGSLLACVYKREDRAVSRDCHRPLSAGSLRQITVLNAERRRRLSAPSSGAHANASAGSRVRVEALDVSPGQPSRRLDRRPRDAQLERAFAERHTHDDGVARVVDIGARGGVHRANVAWPGRWLTCGPGG